MSGKFTNFENATKDDWVDMCDKCKTGIDDQMVEEKFGEQNFQVLSEMRNFRKILVYRP